MTAKQIRNRSTLPAREVPKFEFKNKTANTGEVMIYGPIGEDYFGEGISGKTFAKELKALGNVRTIDLRVDSPGGSVTDARTIYTLLAEHPAKVNVFIDGYAASAASFISMAGDEISIAEGGFFMIHEARGVARGTADDMARAATLLKTISDTIAQTYVARTGQSKAQVAKWMAAETWFTGAEAVAAGFATKLMENKRITACAYPSEFKNLPIALRPTAVRARQVKARLERFQNAR